MNPANQPLHTVVLNYSLIIFTLILMKNATFAQVSHEYLIEQMQYQSYAAGKTFDLNFNHPVKGLRMGRSTIRENTASVHGGKSTFRVNEKW